MRGVANNRNDILIAQFKKVFVLTDFESGLVQSAFYFGYFTFAIPAALAMKRFGYKAAVIFGLLLYGCGALLFYPAAQAHQYSYFLTAPCLVAILSPDLLGMMALAAIHIVVVVPLVCFIAVSTFARASAAVGR